MLISTNVAINIGVLTSAEYRNHLHHQKLDHYHTILLNYIFIFDICLCRKCICRCFVDYQFVQYIRMFILKLDFIEILFQLTH